jgi:hypothetical protein
MLGTYIGGLKLRINTTNLIIFVLKGLLLIVIYAYIIKA